MSQSFEQWVAEVFAGLPLPPPTSPPLTPIVGFPPVPDPGGTPADDGDDPLRDVVQLFGDAATTMVDAGSDVMSTIEGIFDDLGTAIGEIPFDAFINGIEGVAPERVLAAKREAEAFERENDISMQSLANMLAGFAAQPGALESLQGFAVEVMSDREIAANLAKNLGPFQEPLSTISSAVFTPPEEIWSSPTLDSNVQIAAARHSRLNEVLLFARGTGGYLIYAVQSLGQNNEPSIGPWEYPSIQIQLSGSPTAIEDGKGGIVVVARAADGSVTVLHVDPNFDPSVDQPWKHVSNIPAGGIITGRPAAGMTTDGRVYLVALGPDGWLWETYLELTSTPAPAASGANTTRKQRWSKFTGQFRLPGGEVLPSAGGLPFVFAADHFRPEVVVRDLRRDGWIWSDGNTDPGGIFRPLVTDLVGCRDRRGGLHVFAGEAADSDAAGIDDGRQRQRRTPPRRPFGRLLHQHATAPERTTQWGDPNFQARTWASELVDATIASTPTCIAGPDGRVWVFFLDQSMALQVVHIEADGTAALLPHDDLTRCLSSPTVVADRKGRLQLFAVRGDGTPVWAFQDVEQLNGTEPPVPFTDWRAIGETVPPTARELPDD